MRHLIFAAILSFFSITITAQSTEWTVTQTLEPYPTSFLSIWLSSPGSSTISILYSGTAAVDFRVRVTLINSSNKELMKAKSPLEQFTSGPNSLTYAGSDVFSWSDITYDNTTMVQILRSNRFPEGTYTQKVEVFAANGTTLLAENSGSFTIIYPDSPVLFGPANQSTVDYANPIFSWATINLPATVNANYNLKIVEKLSGQTANQALSANPDHHAATIINGGNYVYPQDAYALTNGKEYVWKIRVVDDNDIPLATNDGNSEFWTFTYSNPTAPGFVPPFTRIDLKRNVAWFSDFESLNMISSGDNYIYNGTTTLKLKLSGTETTDLTATVENLTFPKNQSNPSTFSAGRVTATIPSGTLASSITGSYFTPASVEFTSADGLVIKGTIKIPNGTTTFTEDISIPVNASGELQGTVSSSNSEDNPVISFGNSAVKVNLTAYKVVFPGGAISYSGKVLAFGDKVLSSFTSLSPNSSGNLTGTIESETAVSLEAVPASPGRFTMKFNGGSGSFTFDVSTGASSISVTLSEPKFNVNVSGLFEKALTGSASFTAGLRYNSTEPNAPGLQVQNASSFTTTGVPFSENGLKFSNSHRADVSTLRLDSLTASGESFDFKMSLTVTHKFPGLSLYITPIENVVFTKRGISLPALTSATVESETNSGNSRIIDGFQVTFQTATSSAALWTGGTNNQAMTLDVKVRLSGLPVGSSEDLFQLELPLSGTITGSGLTLTFPQKTFTSSFIQLPGSIKYNLKEWGGSITGTVTNGEYGFISELAVKGSVSLPADIFGNSEAHTWDLGSGQLRMNAKGQLTGKITGASGLSGYMNGIFPVGFSNPEIDFQMVEDVQKIYLGRSGSVNLEPLSGSAQNAAIQLQYEVTGKELKSFSGSYSSQTALNIPPGTSSFKLNTNSLSVQPNGMIVNGRTTVSFSSTESTPVTADGVRFRYSDGRVDTGKIVFDNGFGVTINLANGTTNASYSTGLRSGEYTAGDGMVFNTPVNCLYTHEGLTIATGNDSAFLRYKGMTYRMEALYTNLKADVSPFKVISGYIDFKINGVIAARLNKTEFKINENALPVLPEKIALLSGHIAYIQIKDGSNYLVDYSHEGNQVRIQTRTGQPVKAYFRALSFKNPQFPEIPVTFNILLNTSDYSIASGEITADIPAADLSKFDLTVKGIPAKLKSFKYSKGSSGLYTITFGSIISMFDKDMNTQPVDLTLNGDGTFGGDFITTPNAVISLSSGIDDGMIVFQADTVRGNINTQVLNFATAQYEIDVAGGIRLKMADNTYQGAGATFRFTGGNSSLAEISNYRPDDFSNDKKFPVNKVSFDLSMLKISELRYNYQTKALGYKVLITGRPEITSRGFTLRAPKEVEDIILDNTIGMRIPSASHYYVEAESDTFRLSGFEVKIRHFASYGRTVRTMSNAKPIQLGFAFQLVFGCPDFPENFPVRLKGLRFYVQTARYGNNDELYGNIVTTTLSGVRHIPIGNNWGGFLVNKVGGRLAVTNDQQTVDVEAIGGYFLPNHMRESTNPYGWIPFSETATVKLNSKGLLTGTIANDAFTNSSVNMKVGRAEYVVTNRTLTLGVSNNAQTSVLSGNTAVKLLLNGTNTTTANGTGFSFDLVEGKHTAGTVNFQNVKVALPLSMPSFEFSVASLPFGPDGITFNGAGNLKAGTEQKGVAFSNWKLNSKDFGYISGQVAFPTAFRMSVVPIMGLMFYNVLPTTYTETADPNVVLNIAANSATLTDKLTFTGQGTASARNQGGTEDNLRLAFEEAPEIRFSDFVVSKGSLSLYKGTTKVGFINSGGLSLTQIGSPMPENLVLGAMTTGYIKLRDGNTELAQKDEVSNGLRIRNKTGQTLQMFVPGLQYGDATVPVFNVTLDVVINKTTGAVVSGTITHTAAAGQVLKDLSAKGIPFKVKTLKYSTINDQYRLTASGVTALPAVLSALETEISDVWFSNGKLTGIRNNGNITQSYNATGGYKKIAVIGPMATFKMQAAEYTFGDNASYKISGDISSKLFKGTGNDTSYIHYTATFVNNQFAFTFTPSSSDGLNIGKFRLSPEALGTSPAISIAFYPTDFLLYFNGSLEAPQMAAGFSITLAGLAVNKTTAAANPINITTTAQQQTFTMFASDFIVKNNGTTAAVTISYAQDILFVGMNGSMNFMGTDLPFTNFFVNSAGFMNIGGTNTGSFVPANSPVTMLANRLRVTNLGLVTVNNEYNLRATVSYQLPAPATAGWNNGTFDIPASQAKTGTKNLTFLNEAPSLGNDVTEYNFWAGKYDVQYVGLKIDFSDYGASELQQVSTFYADGVSTHKNIRFGTVSGGTITPGLSMAFDNSNSWVDELELTNDVSFKYNNLSYDLDEEDISFDTLSNGGFKMVIGGEVKIAMTGVFEGSLTFSGLEVTSDNKVNKFKESLTGGSVSVGNLFSASLTRFAMSTTPTNIYIPDPNGEKVTSGPDKGKVKTLVQPVNSFLVFGGTLQVGEKGGGILAEGGVDSFLVYQRRNLNGSDGGTNFVIANFNFKKQDKFEFKVNLALLNGDGGDFSVVVAGMVKVSDNSFVAAGKLAKWKGKFSAGIFLAATDGLKIQIGPVQITGVGGGFFFNPTDADIKLIRDLCEFTDEYTKSIKDKVAGAPVTQPPLLAIFIYGGAAIGSKEALNGRILLTIANNKLILDGRIDVLNRKDEIYGLLNVEVGFIQPYVEGTLAVTVKIADGNVLDANGQMQFFYYSSSNWGLVGSASIKVLKGIMKGSGDFYAGNKGFFVGVEFNAGFDVWIIEVNAGFALKAWYKPDISWGAYFRLTLSASVLGGVASARGELKGVLIGSPEFALAGGASLRIRVLFVSWSGSIWMRIKKDGVRAGFGSDPAVDKLIAQAENMANDMLKAVNDAKANMVANKPIPTLGITPEVIAAASAELLKIMKKARTLESGNALTQAQKDSINAWVTSELYGANSDADATLRTYLTKLTGRILDNDGSLSRTSIANALTEMNSAANAYKTAVSDMSIALGEFALTIEVPSAVDPEGVEDPVGATRFTFPTARNTEPTATDPSFSLNTGMVINNSTKVQSFMVSAENYHDLLKKNIERIDTAIARFDRVFKNANSSYLTIGTKYLVVREKVEAFNKRLSEYYFNDIRAIIDYKTWSDQNIELFKNALDYKFDSRHSYLPQWQQIARLDQDQRVRLYNRWGRIRSLSGSFSTPWDPGTFNSVWNAWGDDTKKTESKAQGVNLYYTIPGTAFVDLNADRKNMLASVSREFSTKMKEIDDLAATYTSMLDEVFAKRRKMSENLFEVTERFIYWKDKAPKNANDKTGDFKNIAPTLTQLKAKRTAIIASNTAPELSVTSSSTTNNKYYADVKMNWTGSHPDGIVDYSLASMVWSSGASGRIILPFKTLSKATALNLIEFNDGLGEHYKYGEYTIRARSGSGFYRQKKVTFQRINLGFTDANINTPVSTQNNTIPPDNTPPYMFYPGAPGQAARGLWIIGMPQVRGANIVRTPYGNEETPHFITNKTNEVRIMFNASDEESGVSSFEYKILKRNLRDTLEVVRDWTNIGAINEYLIQGLNMQQGMEYTSQSTWDARVSAYQTDWANFTRYLICMRAINGANLKSREKYVVVCIDTLRPPKVQFTTMTEQTTINQGWASTVQHLNQKLTPPLPNYEQETRSITLFFPFNYQNYSPSEYIYQLYALPGDIPVYPEPRRDLNIQAQKRGSNIYYDGKLVEVPPQFLKYKRFRLEMMQAKITGAVSDLDTSSRHIPLPFYNDVNDRYNWRPNAPVFYWFAGIPPGHQGSYPNGNINLYFKTLGDHNQGIRKYLYRIQTNSGRYTEWKDLPPIPEDRILRLDSAFFAGSETWLKPGDEFEVDVRPMSGNYYMYNISRANQMILPAKSPKVQNFSVDIVKKFYNYVPYYAVVLTMFKEPVTTTKSYYIRTEQFVNGKWVTPAKGNSRMFHYLQANGTPFDYWHDLWSGQYTNGMMPFRNANSSGTGYVTGGEFWRIYVKSIDADGNESPEVMKEMVW